MFAVAATAIIIAMALALCRAFVGPTIYDRILAVNAHGTMTVLLIAVPGRKSETMLWRVSVSAADSIFCCKRSIYLKDPKSCSLLSRFGTCRKLPKPMASCRCRWMYAAATIISTSIHYGGR